MSPRGQRPTEGALDATELLDVAVMGGGVSGALPRPLVVAGDGGFMMICQELSSLVRAKCDAIVFVMSNQGDAIEQAFVDLKAFEEGGQFAPYDELPVWDYLALAKASTTAELQSFLEQETTAQGTTLVEEVVPPKDLPPQLRRLAELASTLVRAHRRQSVVKR